LTSREVSAVTRASLLDIFLTGDAMILFHHFRGTYEQGNRAHAEPDTELRYAYKCGSAADFLDTLDCTTQNLSFTLQVRQLAKLEADGTEVTQRRLGSGVHKNI